MRNSTDRPATSSSTPHSRSHSWRRLVSPRLASQPRPSGPTLDVEVFVTVPLSYVQDDIKPLYWHESLFMLATVYAIPAFASTGKAPPITTLSCPYGNCANIPNGDHVGDEITVTGCYSTGNCAGTTTTVTVYLFDSTCTSLIGTVSTFFIEADGTYGTGPWQASPAGSYCILVKLTSVLPGGIPSVQVSDGEFYTVVSTGSVPQFPLGLVVLFVMAIPLLLVMRKWGPTLRGSTLQLLVTATKATSS